MSQRMRWVPAKSKQLGQAVPAGNVSATPAPAPVLVQEQAVPVSPSTTLQKVIYGGLVLAGAAAFITFVFGND